MADEHRVFFAAIETGDLERARAARDLYKAYGRWNGNLDVIFEVAPAAQAQVALEGVDIAFACLLQLAWAVLFGPDGRGLAHAKAAIAALGAGKEKGYYFSETRIGFPGVAFGPTYAEMSWGPHVQKILDVRAFHHVAGLNMRVAAELGHDYSVGSQVARLEQLRAVGWPTPRGAATPLRVCGLLLSERLFPQDSPDLYGPFLAAAERLQAAARIKQPFSIGDALDRHATGSALERAEDNAVGETPKGPARTGYEDLEID